MAKREAKKVQVNPHQELASMVQELGLTQFRIHLTRQDPIKKTWRTVTHFTMSPDDIGRIEEIARSQYGGGNYIVHIMHPADVKERYYSYGFEIEGDPMHPAIQGGNVNTVWDPTRQQFVPAPPQQQQGFYGQMQQGFQGPQIHPGVMQPPMGYGSPYYPPPYPPPYYQPPQRDSGPSPVEARLNEQNELLKQQLGDMNRKFEEERHQREIDRRESENARKLDEMKAATERQIAEIKAALDKTSDKDSNTMLTTMLELNKGTQEAIIEMKKSEVVSAKANLEMQMKQIEKDFEQRKQMMDWVRQAQDPGKHAELLDRFGQFAANQLNMITGIAQSGLLQPQDNEPGWMQPLREVIDGAKEFGNKYLDNQEQRQRTQAHQSRNAYSHVQGRQLPGPAAAPGGYGGQARPPQIPPQQPPAQQQQQPPPQQPDGEIFIGEIPESMKLKFQAIGKAVYFKKDPAMVAEMIYNIVDNGRYWPSRGVPEEGTPDWMLPIFETPKAIIEAMFKKHAPQVPLDEKYLDELEFHFLQIHKQFLAETGQPPPEGVIDSAPQEPPPSEQQPPQQPPQEPPQEPPAQNTSGEGPEKGDAALPKDPGGAGGKKGKKKAKAKQQPGAAG